MLFRVAKSNDETQEGRPLRKTVSLHRVTNSQNGVIVNRNVIPTD